MLLMLSSYIAGGLFRSLSILHAHLVDPMAAVVVIGEEEVGVEDLLEEDGINRDRVKHSLLYKIFPLSIFCCSLMST